MRCNAGKDFHRSTENATRDSEFKVERVCKTLDTYVVAAAEILLTAIPKSAVNFPLASAGSAVTSRAANDVWTVFITLAGRFGLNLGEAAVMRLQN